MIIINTPTQQRIIDAIPKVRAKPDLSGISKVTGIPIQTVSDSWKAIIKNNHVKLVISAERLVIGTVEGGAPVLTSPSPRGNLIRKSAKKTALHKAKSGVTHKVDTKVGPQRGPVKNRMDKRF